MLQVFKSVPVVQEVHRWESLPDSALNYRRGTITLGWEERQRGRGRRRSDQGVEFATALARGTVLREGDCLVISGEELVVQVIERTEPVLVIKPEGPARWAFVGYCIGNSHQPVMITDEAIVCADAPGMEDILKQHGVSFMRSARPFTPVGTTDDVYGPPHRHVPR